MEDKILNRKGFTLVELLIAMAMMVIVLGAIYSLYIFFIQASTGQDKLIEIQQEARVAMERIAKDVRAAGCYYRNTPIITATGSTLEFESDPDPSPAKGPWKIKYEIDTVNNELERDDAEWNDSTSSYGAYTTGQVVAGHVTGLTFVYYDENNASISTPITSQANRDLIRKVDVTLVAQTDDVNPSTKKVDSISLNTSVHLRCMGVQQSTDTTECALPTGIASADPSTCGRLNITWTASSSSDAAGYKIYYRTTGASFFSGVLDIPGGSTSSYTVTGLQDGVQYDIAMRCYDTSGNLNVSYMGSATDVPLTGTSGSTDTKPDDSTAPDQPTGTDATAGDGYATLTWSASTAVDTGGYNVYRSDDGGTNYTNIASVDSTVLTYSDTTVTNCPSQPYYYKVTSWDCKPNESLLATQAAVYGDAAKPSGITDAPVDGVTNTEPTETTPPADPTSFGAIAGADRIYLSYTTPTDIDLDGVRILRRTDQTPVDENDPAAVGPNNQTDYAPLTPSQTYSLVDTAGIVDGTTYFYRAFSYDGCSNFSAGTISQATAQPCGDGSSGSKHFGPPSAPVSLTPTVCSTASLSWPASTGSENGNTFDPATENDVVGYNVHRGTVSGGPYTQLNTDPVTSTSYADATVVAGGAYYYVVTAVDCANNESTINSPEAEVIPSGIDWDYGVDVVSSGTTGITGSQHNIVNLGIKNLGNTSVTIDSATITWTTATAYIKKVTLKPFGGSTNTLWDDTSLPLTASGVNIDFAAYQPDASLRRLSAASTLDELNLEFRESDNGGFVDLRGTTLNITLYYTNDNAGSSCTAATFSVPVPMGPVISSTTQNRPTEPTMSNLNTGTVVVAAGTQDASYVWTLYDVNVQSTITPETSTTLSTAKLYYSTTDRSTTTAPSTDYSTSPSGWTSMDMCQVGSTNVYQTASAGTCTSAPIPTSLGKRVWYYVKADDSKTNYDIEPEPSVGIYVYDQDSRFNIIQYVGRFNPRYSWGGNGKYVDVWYYVTDSDSTGVTGATVKVTIVGSGGGTEGPVDMTDCSTTSCTGPSAKPDSNPVNGWYYYAATDDFTDKEISVSVTVTKSQFTDAACGDTSIAKNISTWDTKTCN